MERNRNWKTKEKQFVMEKFVHIHPYTQDTYVQCIKNHSWLPVCSKWLSRGKKAFFVCSQRRGHYFRQKKQFFLAVPFCYRFTWHLLYTQSIIINNISHFCSTLFNWVPLVIETNRLGCYAGQKAMILAKWDEKKICSTWKRSFFVGFE